MTAKVLLFCFIVPCFTGAEMRCTAPIGYLVQVPGTSKATPNDAEYVTEILGDKNNIVKSTKVTFFLFQGKIGALNRLNSQINVLMFMSKFSNTHLQASLLPKYYPHNLYKRWRGQKRGKGEKEKGRLHHGCLGGMDDPFVFKMPSCCGCCSVNQLHDRFYLTGYRQKYGSSTVGACAGFCFKNELVTLRVGDRRQHVHNSFTK